MADPFNFSGLQNFIRFISSGEARTFTDVRLTNRTKSVDCHRMVLASHSPFLREIFLSHNHLEELHLVLDDLSSEALEAAVNFMYTGGKPRNDQDLLEACRVLGIQRCDYVPKARRPSVQLPVLKAGPREIWLPQSLNRVPDMSASLLESESDDHSDDDEEMGLTVKAKKRKLMVDKAPLKRRREMRIKVEKNWMLNKENSLTCCQMKFPTVQQLRNHQSTVLVYCCDKPFRSHYLYEKHSRKIHASQVKGVFISKDELKRREECCEENFSNKFDYLRHRRDVHLEIFDGNWYFRCCDKVFLRSNSVKQHLEEIHKLDETERRANCCNTTFDEVTDISSHVKMGHGFEVRKYQRIRCCEVQLDSIEKFETHKEESPHVECSYCLFISKEPLEMERHVFKIHQIGTTDCSACGKKFGSLVNLRNHHNAVHSANSFICEECGKIFSNRMALRNHQHRHGGGHNPLNKEWFCLSCDETFDSIAKRLNHMRLVHKGKDSHSCNFCESIFREAYQLKQHISSVHEKQRNFACAICGNRFFNASQVRAHEKYAHDEKAVHCDKCGQDFQNSDRLNDHIRRVHIDRFLPCPHCQLRFKSNTNLKYHVMVRHTDGKDMPYQCEVCHKGFTHESRKKAHMPIHENVKPFNCKYCGRPNSSKGNNQKHEKTCAKKHGDVKREEVVYITVEGETKLV